MSLERTRNVGFTIDVGPLPEASAVQPDKPLCIVVLGDFSGSEGQEVHRMAQRRIHSVNRDNFDEVMAGITPRLDLSSTGEETWALSFESLADFRPENLASKIPHLRSLLELRESLLKPGAPSEPTDSHSSALRPEAEGHSGMEGERSDSGSGPGHVGDPDRGNPPSFLDQIVDRTVQEEPQEGEELSPALSAFLKRTVAPHLRSALSEKDEERIAWLNEEIAGILRVVLHHPGFQALEALWRSVSLLTRRLRTDSSLRLAMMDVSAAQLAFDLLHSPDLSESTVFRLLMKPPPGVPGEARWNLVVGAYSFGSGAGEVELLGALAHLGHALDAPVLVAGEPSLIGSDLGVLRRHHHARYLGILLPRFLVRLPYGERDEPVEGFPFEEMPAPPSHGDYLWGNPAILGALFAGQSWQARSAPGTTGPVLEVDGLPVHLFENEGVKETKPCAEILLSERMAESLLDQGIMPLASIKDTGRVRLIRFQSVSEPVSALAGKGW